MSLTPCDTLMLQIPEVRAAGDRQAEAMQRCRAFLTEAATHSPAKPVIVAAGLVTSYYDDAQTHGDRYFLSYIGADMKPISDVDMDDVPGVRRFGRENERMMEAFDNESDGEGSTITALITGPWAVTQEEDGDLPITTGIARMPEAGRCPIYELPEDAAALLRTEAQAIEEGHTAVLWAGDNSPVEEGRTALAGIVLSALETMIPGRVAGWKSAADEILVSHAKGGTLLVHGLGGYGRENFGQLFAILP